MEVINSKKLDFNISKKTYGTNRTCLTFRNNRVLQWVLVVAHCSVFSLVCFGPLCVFLSLFHWALSAFLLTLLITHLLFSHFSVGLTACDIPVYNIQIFHTVLYLFTCIFIYLNILQIILVSYLL